MREAAFAQLNADSDGHGLIVAVALARLWR